MTTLCWLRHNQEKKQMSLNSNCSFRVYNPAEVRSILWEVVIVATPPPPPSLNLGQSPVRPKRVLWKWSLGVTTEVVAFLAWQCGSALYQGPELSNAAVKQFHLELNGANYEEICDRADQGFTNTNQRDDLVKFLTAVHAKLGNAVADNLTNVRVNTNTGGTFLVTQYSTEFERGSAVETFTWIKSNGAVKLYGYNINSKELVLN
jgi:hypothetical protein